MRSLLVVITVFFFSSANVLAGALPIYWSTCIAEGYNAEADMMELVRGDAMSDIIAADNAIYLCRDLGLQDCAIISCVTEEYDYDKLFREN